LNGVLVHLDMSLEFHDLPSERFGPRHYDDDDDDDDDVMIK